MPERFQDALFKALPGIYREGDEGGGDGKATLTYRLLGLFAEILEEMEGEVYGLHREFDPKRAGAKFLPWLASWVALELDETWEESKRRDLVGRIVSLYRLRGTVEGLKSFVEIYTGIRPDIIEEGTGGWQVGVRSTVEVDLRIYGTWEEDAHRFSVLAKTFEELSPERKAKIRERVLIEKPAHTQLVHVGFTASFWRIGVRSTVGVDTKAGG